MGWTRREIREHILTEVADLTNTNLEGHVNRAINLARRQMCNVKGGKLKFLRKYWDYTTTAGNRYVELDADLRIIRLVWDMTNDAEVEYQDEDVWRGENGEQQTTDTQGAPTGFLLDSQLAGTTNKKQMELTPIPDAAYPLRLRGWRRLLDLTDTDDDVEITDVPDEFQHGLILGVRYHTLLFLSKATDLLAGARREWMEFLAELAATEEDTILREVRIKTQAEIDRAGHRQSLGFTEGEY